MTESTSNLYFTPRKRSSGTIEISVERRLDFPGFCSTFSQVFKKKEKDGDPETVFIFTEPYILKTSSGKNMPVHREFPLNLYVSYKFKQELKDEIQKIVDNSADFSGEDYSLSKKLYGLAIALSSLLALQVGISISKEDNSISMFVF